MMDIERFRSEHVPTDSAGTLQSENDYTLDVAVDGSAFESEISYELTSSSAFTRRNPER